MNYKLDHDVETLGQKLARFDIRTTDERSLGCYLAPRPPEAGREQAACDWYDALLRQLLPIDAALMTDDEIRGRLARIWDDRPGAIPPGLFDVGFARTAAKPGSSIRRGFSIPVANGLLLPALAPSPARRPIILHGAAPELVPFKLFLPTSPESLLGDSADDVALRAVETDRPATDESAEADAIDLSTALTACLADTRAQVRSGPARRRSSGKRTPWAIAAALAAMAIVSSVGLPRSTREPAMKVAVAAPVLAPAPAISVVSPTPHDGLVPRTTVAPAATLPHEAKLERAPVRAAPSKLAVVEPASASRVESSVRATKVESAPPHDEASNGVIVAPAVAAPQAATPAIVPRATAISPQKAAIGRVAKRRPVKITAGKRTNVASVLVLPDVLKPQ